MGKNSKNKMSKNVKLCITFFVATICLLAAVVGITLSREGNAPHSDTRTALPDTEAESTVTPTEPKALVIKDISAELTNEVYVLLDSDFIITAQNATVETLSVGISVSPKVDYSIAEEGENTFRLSLSNTLLADSSITIKYTENGAEVYERSFQTVRSLHVVKTFPEDTASNVKESDKITVTLSEEVEGLSDYISIIPETDGVWERDGKKWHFTPNSPWSLRTKYTVQIAPGLISGGTVMERKFIFAFTLDGFRAPDYAKPNIDGTLNFTPDEPITIRCKDNHGDPPHSLALYSLPDLSAYLSYMNLEGAEPILIGEQAISLSTLDSDDNVHDLQFDNMGSGYYVARIYTESGAPYVEIPIQISEVQAYLLATEAELLIYADSPCIYADNEYVPDESKMIRLQRDKHYDRVTVTGATPISIALPAESIGGSPNAYLNVSKNGNYLNFSGKVPTDREWTSPLTVECEGLSVTVTPDENGVFSGKIESDAPYSVHLTYEGETIAQGSFSGGSSVSEEGYIYDFIFEKNYAYYGEKYDFSVKVTDEEDDPIGGKTVYIRSENMSDSIAAVTDGNGMADFTLELPEDGIGSTACNIQAFGDEGKYDPMNLMNPDFVLWILHKDIYNKNAIYSDSAIYTQGVNAITLYPRNYNVESVGVFGGQFLNYGAVDPSLTISGGTVEIIQKTYTRERTEERQYKGKTYYSYSSDTKTEEKLIDTLSVAPGNVFRIPAGKYILPLPTDTVKYELYAKYSITLSTGEEAMGGSTFDRTGYADHDNQLSHYYSGVNTDTWDTFYALYNCYENCYYRFILSKSNSFDMYIGETFSLPLFDSVDKEYASGGELTLIYYKDRIISKETFPLTDRVDITYLEEYGEGIKMTGFYRKDGKLYRLPSYTVKCHEDELLLPVSISTDKGGYAEGEQVTLEINVGVQDVASVTVNVRTDHSCRTAGYTVQTHSIRNASSFMGYSFSTLFDHTLDPNYLYYEGEHYPSFSRPENTVYTATVKTDENGHATVTFPMNVSAVDCRITVEAVTEYRIGGEQLYISAN